MLSFEYPFARVSVIFKHFLHHFVLAKLATSSIRVKLSLTQVWVFEKVASELGLGGCFHTDYSQLMHPAYHGIPLPHIMTSHNLASSSIWLKK